MLPQFSVHPEFTLIKCNTIEILRPTRANPFPKVTGLFCRLPLPALFILSRGCSPWGPDAVIGTPRRGKKLQMDFQGLSIAYWTAGTPRRSYHEYLFLSIIEFHSVQSRLNRKDNSAQCYRQRLHLKLRHRVHIRVREF